MGHTFERSRRERFNSLTSNGAISLKVLARVLRCPEPSVRRLIQEMRREGFDITLFQGLVRNYGWQA